MEKMIPYEKLSKKKQRELNKARRGTWGAIKPITRKPENSRAYDRRKAHQWKREPPQDVPFILIRTIPKAENLCYNRIHI